MEVVIVKEAVSPALIGVFAAVFVVVTSGFWQTIVALEFGIVPVFVPVVCAVFGIVPQALKLVGAVSVTEREAPELIAPQLQVRTPAAMEQSALFSDQVYPAGRLSVTTTPVA